jgi:RNA polymerase sigma factor (sigma-70 family)
VSPFEAARAALTFARARPDLVRYVTRFTGDADLAEDVVQDTYLRLRERPPEDGSGIRGWLFRVATNLARDATRTDRRRARLAQGAPARLPGPEPLPDPAALSERSEVRERVRAALETLNEKERTALLMREEGFTHREIAEAVGTTTKSVGTLVARALEKMARGLDLEAL